MTTDAYAKQGDTRTIKHLFFTYIQEVPSPVIPGQTVYQERMLVRGDKVKLDELTPMAKEKGERLDAFYTDADLSGDDADPTGGGVAEFDLMGTHELSEYIRDNKPNVEDTVAMASNSPEVAARVLEAEEIATDNDARAGVVKGLQKIIDGGNA